MAAFGGTPASDVTTPIDDTSTSAESDITSGPGTQVPGSFPPVGGGYGVGDGFRFSARTCLAMLPLLPEPVLDAEIAYLGNYNLTSPSFRPRGISRGNGNF
jgi:hypothetical protein